MANPGGAPGPYRATKLWNEVTTHFRAGMPLRKHRQHFKRHGNCFTACEAVDWLCELLRNNSNFGPEVTRQQTIQLLRKFLKNHVIEDIKGRWGSENLEDNGQLFRFPTTSPLKTIPRHPPELRKNSAESTGKEKESLFKLRNLSRRTPRKQELRASQEYPENMKCEAGENKENPVDRREISQADVEEIWRHIILIHLQTILGISSLEEVLDPSQVIPQHIMYNMSSTSKHGVVVLQNRSDDLPHWVLSAMKCLANWPKHDMSQPTYVGFERDVFRTIADYFSDLPEPLLTFEYYELFVNILVVCGYTVPQRSSGKHETHDPESSKSLHFNNMNSFKSTECLLLSLLRQDKNKDDSGFSETLQVPGRQPKSCARKVRQFNSRPRRARANEIIGGSCQNLASLRNEQARPSHFRPRCYSLEGIADSPRLGESEVSDVLPRSDLGETVRQNDADLPDSEATDGSGLNHDVRMNSPKPPGPGFKRTSALTVRNQEELGEGKCESKQLCRSQSLLLSSNVRKRCHINTPVAEITVPPNSVGHLGRNTSVSTVTESDTDDSCITVNKRICKSTLELSGSRLPPASMLTGSQSLLRPHLERVAIDALQICCLLLPPPNRRKLQLLMRMISRMSQNVDMPRLHDAMGTRSLMIQTFSRCVLCCAEEVDLDELLATRLVSFLMDHHEEILKVPSYLQAAVETHLDYLKKGQIQYPGEELIAALPTYSYCKQISAREFDEQKISTSQAAIAELLENIVKDKSLPLKDKRKRLKQFQKEYPLIYQNRFPTTESEAALFADKPTIKQPMLILKKPKFRSLRY
ncbi:DEP domain-containing protein 1A isoform X1 [Ornithorhynchus anatinus]|nr:DEP domain-containing protein 1A isoform X1 [Ornithorhynchus anatinus]